MQVRVEELGLSSYEHASFSYVREAWIQQHLGRRYSCIDSQVRLFGLKEGMHGKCNIMMVRYIKKGHGYEQGWDMPGHLHRSATSI